MHKNNTKDTSHTYIGDMGVVEKKDIFGTAVIIVSVIIIAVLITLGTMALTY